MDSLNIRLSADARPVLSLADLIELIREQIQLQRANLWNASSVDECQSSISIIVVYEYALIPAILMILIACFTVVRSNMLPELCNGRPGLAHPMNTLEDRSVRLSYALAFGISAQLCYDLLVGDSDLFKLNVTSKPDGPYKFLHVLYRFCEVCLYCAVMYPIFLAISKKNKWFFAMGTLYMWTFTAVSVARLVLVECSEIATENEVTHAFKYLPSIVCSVGLSIIFPYRLVELTFSKGASITDSEYVYQYDYVRELIKAKPQKALVEGTKQTLLRRLREQLKKLRYTRKNGFRYSPRIICTYTAVAIVMYMVTYNIVNEVHYWNKVIGLFLTRIERLAERIGGDSGKAILDQLIIMRKYVLVIYTCFILAMTLTTLLNVINIFLMVVNYRSNILQMYEGNYQNLPTRKENTTVPTFLLVNNMRYGGYQITFTAVAMVLQIVSFLAVFLFLSLVLLDPISGKLREWFVEFLEYTWPLGAVSATVLLAQFILVKLAFNARESSQGKIAINNRHVYFNWAYFMFYFNVFWGIVTAIIQLVASAVLAICFLSRLDWCFFPKRFEFLDEGYFAYVGLLYIENAHTNPVMRTFLAIMRDRCRGAGAAAGQDNLSVRYATRTDLADQFQAGNERDLELASFSTTSSLYSGSSAALASVEGGDYPTHEQLKRTQARNRWFLALTLANNPALQQHRWHYISRFNDLIKRRTRAKTEGRLNDSSRVTSTH